MLRAAPSTCSYRIVGALGGVAGFILGADSLAAAEAGAAKTPLDSPPASVAAPIVKAPPPKQASPAVREVRPTVKLPSHSATTSIQQKIKQTFPYIEKTPEPAAPTATKGDGKDAILMPTVIVREAKIPVLSEEDVLSEAKRSALSRKSYMGEDYGALKIHEDKRLNLMKDIQGLAGERELKRRLQESSFRKSDPILDAMDKAVNNGRR